MVVLFGDMLVYFDSILEFRGAAFLVGVSWDGVGTLRIHFGHVKNRNRTFSKPEKGRVRKLKN